MQGNGPACAASLPRLRFVAPATEIPPRQAGRSCLQDQWYGRPQRTTASFRRHRTAQRREMVEATDYPDILMALWPESSKKPAIPRSGRRHAVRRKRGDVNAPSRLILHRNASVSNRIPLRLPPLRKFISCDSWPICSTLFKSQPNISCVVAIITAKFSKGTRRIPGTFHAQFVFCDLSCA